MNQDVKICNNFSGRKVSTSFIWGYTGDNINNIDIISMYCKEKYCKEKGIV